MLGRPFPFSHRRALPSWCSPNCPNPSSHFKFVCSFGSTGVNEDEVESRSWRRRGQRANEGDGRGSMGKSKYLLVFYRVENLPCFTSAAPYGKIEPSNFTVCLLPSCCYICNKVGLAFSWIHRAKVFIHNCSVLTLASKGCAHKSWCTTRNSRTYDSSQGGLALSLVVQAGGLKILGLPR